MVQTLCPGAALALERRWIVKSKFASCRSVNRKLSEKAKCLCFLLPGLYMQSGKTVYHYIIERNSTFQARHSSKKKKKIGERKKKRETETPTDS